MRNTAIKLCKDNNLYDLAKVIKNKNNCYPDIFKFIKSMDNQDLIVKLLLELDDDYCKYLYCLDVKERQELWGTIKNDEYKYLYCKDIKDREQLREGK